MLIATGWLFCFFVLIITPTTSNSNPLTRQQLPGLEQQDPGTSDSLSQSSRTKAGTDRIGIGPKGNRLGKWGKVSCPSVYVHVQSASPPSHSIWAGPAASEAGLRRREARRYLGFRPGLHTQRRMRAGAWMGARNGTAGRAAD